MSKSSGPRSLTSPPSVDLQSRRSALATQVVPNWLATGGVWIVSDEAGVGKTYNVSDGLVNRADRAFFACENHERASKDDFSEYHHSKGRIQPRFDDCILGKCDHDDDCPLMCPIYELDESDPLRQEFRRIESVLSHKEAHLRVDGLDSNCSYLKNRTQRDEQNLVVGVHHQLTEFSNWPTVIDETPTIDMFEESWTTADLERAKSALPYWLSDWIDSLTHHISTTDHVDIDIEPPRKSISAEKLAQIKVDYNDAVVDGPLRVDPCFDAILGALATAGFEPEVCRKVIDGPSTLDFCPRCLGRTEGNPLTCSNCYWELDRYDLLDYYRDSHSRVTAYIDGDRLVFTKIPAVDDLPDDVMILDATARPAIVSVLFGVAEDDIVVNEGPGFEPNMNLTEVGIGQYHGAIVVGSDSLRKKMQRAIDRINREHDHVFYVAKSKVLHKFDIPRTGNCVRYYGNLRGFNIHEEWDDLSNIAVCLIGAPHPDIRKVRPIVDALGDPSATGEKFYESRRVTLRGEGTNETETKTYPGLLGEFFRGSREDELVQAIHRVRPILAEQEVNVYKLTNVPTRPPVDEQLTWNEFLNEGVPYRAIRELVNPFCEAFDGGSVETSNSEIYDLIGIDDPRGSDGRRVRRWISILEDSGIAERDGSASDSSRRVTIDMDRLRKIA